MDAGEEGLGEGISDSDVRPCRHVGKADGALA
jgi:hypothetical protein